MVTVRFVSPDDRDSYCRLRFQLWPELPLAEHHKDFDHLIKNDANNACFGAVAYLDNGIAAGFIDFSIRSYVDGCTQTPVAHLEGILVDPAYQRRGVGKKLVAFFEEWARKNNFVEISSDADIDNLISHHAHKDWGFDEVDRIVIFRKPLG